MDDQFADFESLPVELMAFVNEACDQYEAAWSGDAQPDVLPFFVHSPSAAHRALLAEFLRIDQHRLGLLGRSPTLHDYQSLVSAIPELAEAVRLALDDLRHAPTIEFEHGHTPPDAPRDTAQNRHRLPDGAFFGRFQIRAFLGGGGFGAVYRSYDPQFDLEVALKVPHPTKLEQTDGQRRFVEEARSAARLRHPHIVPVYEVGVVESKPYLSNALVAGTTLKRRLADGPAWSFRGAAVLVLKLAEALHYAHTKGVIHRDVSAANILLDAHGEPHITDFGVARRERDGDGVMAPPRPHELADDAATGRPTALDDKMLTREGEGLVIGNPFYMSPEQASGHSNQADARSDLWSLGVVFFELLVGRRPFEAATTQGLAEAICRQPPFPMTEAPRRIPTDLQAICLRCLEKEPSARYPSCQHLADDLQRWLDDAPITARPIGRLRRLQLVARRNPLTFALSSTLGITIVVGFILVAWQLHATRAAERDRTMRQVTQLLTARPDAVPAILQDLESFRDEVEPILTGMLDGTEKFANGSAGELSPTHRLRLQIAVLPQHPDSLSALHESLLQSEPEELVALRERLTPFAGDLNSWLWSVVDDSANDSLRQLRAASLLAILDADSPRWRFDASRPQEPNAVSQRELAEKIAADPAHQAVWARAFFGQRQQLSIRLNSIAQDINDPRRASARGVLAAFFRNERDIWVNDFLSAQSVEFDIYRPLLLSQRDSVIELLWRVVRNVDGAKADAVRTANAATALLYLLTGDSQPTDSLAELWSLLAHDTLASNQRASDPSLRSELIHRLGRLGVRSEVLSGRFLGDHDNGVRAALLMALGEYPTDRLRPDAQQAIMNQLRLTEVYAKDQHAGVHGAAAWLLRKWGQSGVVAEIDAQLAHSPGQPRSDRQWWINGQGLTMVAIRGPRKYYFGSRMDEDGRMSNEEIQTAQELIDAAVVPIEKATASSFAISAYEITREQFGKFLEAARKQSPSADAFPDSLLASLDKVAEALLQRPDLRDLPLQAPAGAINTHLAASYCNWLTRRDGFAGQECYELVPIASANGVVQGGLPTLDLGIRFHPDWRRRTGYRLPLQSEWECACRAGAATSRYYGDNELLLPNYGWHAKSFRPGQKHVLQPVGQLKPNDFGLFDMYGNAKEWCWDPRDDKQPLDDRAKTLNGAVCRGGAIGDDVAAHRSAARSGHPPTIRDLSPVVGFRVVRLLSTSKEN